MNAAEMISEGTELADADLPSAMTCANYFEAPAVLEQRSAGIEIETGNLRRRRQLRFELKV